MWDMRLLVQFSCVLFLCLPAFAQAELKADLFARAASTKIVADLRVLSEKTHEPTDLALAFFAQDLAGLMRQPKVVDSHVPRLVGEIDAVFKSAGTSTAGFFDHIQNFKTILIEMGVPRGLVDKPARDLETIGRQVRGPEDTPARPVSTPRRR